VVHTAAEEGALNRDTLAASAKGARTADALAAGAQDVGQWTQPVDWPVVGVHVALLPNGKVLAYDSIGDNATESYPTQTSTRATVWDPVTDVHVRVDLNLGYNVFCSGLAHLIDGRLFLAGGNKDQQLNGIVQTTLFDPSASSNPWSRGPDMAAGRWYPTVTALNNGEMLITSGRVNTPEVRKLDGALRSLSTASLGLPLYPWMDVAPNGRAFYSGPDTTCVLSTPVAPAAGRRSVRATGSTATTAAMHCSTSARCSSPAAEPATNDARVVDLNGSTPQVTSTAPMANRRRQHNLTVLADGTVLATGGLSSGASLVDLNAGVYPPSSGIPPPASGRPSRRCR
jgi:hypothetical protein